MPDIPTLPSSLLERWRAIPSAIVADLSAGVCQIDPAIRPLLPPGRQPRLFGRAVTVACDPFDIGGVVRALDLVVPGDVLVIAAQGRAESATIGSVLGGHLRRRGGVGLVCDGAIRDVGDLAAMSDLAVFTRAVTPRGPTSFDGGRVNTPVVCGGRAVARGDLVLGDDDGVVSLTPDEAARTIDAAEAKLGAEARWREGLAAGTSLAALFGLGGDLP